MAHFKIDTLDPNTFNKTGVVKSIYDAWEAGDWVGSFNLWIVQSDGQTGSLLYQQRSFKSLWSPGLLDVTAGGHYEAGESTIDGLREVREELGKDYKFEDLTFLGKKLYLRDQPGKKLRYAVDVFILLDNSPLTSFRLERDELVHHVLPPGESSLGGHEVDGHGPPLALGAVARRPVPGHGVVEMHFAAADRAGPCLHGPEGRVLGRGKGREAGELLQGDEACDPVQKDPLVSPAVGARDHPHAAVGNVGVVQRDPRGHRRHGLDRGP